MRPGTDEEQELAGYLLRRFALMLLTLFGMSVLIFVAMRLVPGDIADILVDSAGIVDPEQKLKIQHELGLDQPLVVQYGQWIGGLLRGDLGYAYVTEKPAIEEILPRLPISAKLAGLALFFAVMIGVPLGVISAVKRNTLTDYILRVMSLSGLSLPAFWLGLLVLMLFVKLFGWIPIYNKPPDTIWKELGLLSIPALVVGFRSSALMMRLTRSSMLEVLRQDYIRTARAKGASEQSVNYDHALRNAVLPVITIVGIEAAFLVGGLIVTETVFNIPGVARFVVEAVRNRDYPIVQNLVMFIGVVVVSINFLVDVLYTVVDPRIRLEA
jgi:peptide/nickel transport system permease protein